MKILLKLSCKYFRKQSKLKWADLKGSLKVWKRKAEVSHFDILKTSGRGKGVILIRGGEKGQTQAKVAESARPNYIAQSSLSLANAKTPLVRSNRWLNQASILRKNKILKIKVKHENIFPTCKTKFIYQITYQ